MAQFFPLAAGLCVERGLGCVAYDMFGCGRSPKPEDWAAYEFAELQRDARAVYTRLASPDISVIFWSITRAMLRVSSCDAECIRPDACPAHKPCPRFCTHSHDS